MFTRCRHDIVLGKCCATSAETTRPAKRGAPASRFNRSTCAFSSVWPAPHGGQERTPKRSRPTGASSRIIPSTEARASGSQCRGSGRGMSPPTRVLAICSGSSTVAVGRNCRGCWPRSRVPTPEARCSASSWQRTGRACLRCCSSLPPKNCSQPASATRRKRCSRMPSVRSGRSTNPKYCGGWRAWPAPLRSGLDGAGATHCVVRGRSVPARRCCGRAARRATRCAWPISSRPPDASISAVWRSTRTVISVRSLPHIRRSGSRPLSMSSGTCRRARFSRRCPQASGWRRSVRPRNPRWHARSRRSMPTY